MNNKCCAVCKSDEVKRIDYRNTWSDLFNDKTILVCNTCGFGRIDPKVDAGSLLTFYRDVYRSKGSPHHTDFSKYIPSPYFYRSRSISQLLLGLQYLPMKKEYNFLDVGAGLGRSFISAKEVISGNINFHAIEEDKEAKKYYHQYIDNNITICSNISEFSNVMDVVLMSHSLEHFDIEDIPSLFSDIHNALTENGIVIIEVPHADFRDIGFEENRVKDTPHLSFFSLESLSKLVESSDFELCFVNTAAFLAKDYGRTRIPAKTGVNVRFKKFFKGLELYKDLSRLKRNLSLKIRSLMYDSNLYKDDNFHYGGDRIALRCILKKKALSD